MDAVADLEATRKRDRRPLSTDREPMYWDIDDVQFHCRIGRSTAWRLVRETGFPPPVVLGRRTLVWPRDEVITFVDNKRDPKHYADVTEEAETAQFVTRHTRRRVG
jgi:predicted DNA-binding transcriptional regulator AlpA